MRHRKLLPALLLSLAALPGIATGQSVPYALVATSPSAPAPGDTVALALSGQWNDTCVPTTSQASVTKAGNALRVHLNYSGFSGVCGAAITPWALTLNVGTLAEGAYTVEVELVRSLLPATTIGTGAFTVAPPQESQLWVPAFWAVGSPYTLASNLTACNNSERSAFVTPIGAWDALGERAVATPPVEIASGGATVVPTNDLRPGQAVQMLALRAPGRIAFRATLQRLETVPPALPKVPESYGRVELPVFTSLFPAGATAVAGDVSLTATECAGGPEVRRRVNLTLFNAGDAAATFQVVGTAVGGGPGGGTSPLTYTVPAGSLVQFNAIPLEGLPVCQAGGAWFKVTGDQPFLAYVSTNRPETAPGILPYEIFPARLNR
jgi:hypothetical protein